MIGGGIAKPQARREHHPLVLLPLDVVKRRSADSEFLLKADPLGKGHYEPPRRAHVLSGDAAASYPGDPGPRDQGSGPNRQVFVFACGHRYHLTAARIPRHRVRWDRPVSYRGQIEARPCADVFPVSLIGLASAFSFDFRSITASQKDDYLLWLLTVQHGLDECQARDPRSSPRRGERAPRRAHFHIVRRQVHLGIAMMINHRLLSDSTQILTKARWASVRWYKKAPCLLATKSWRWWLKALTTPCCWQTPGSTLGALATDPGVHHSPCGLNGTGGGGCSSAYGPPTNSNCRPIPYPNSPWKEHPRGPSRRHMISSCASSIFGGRGGAAPGSYIDEAGRRASSCPRPAPRRRVLPGLSSPDNKRDRLLSDTQVLIKAPMPGEYLCETIWTLSRPSPEGGLASSNLSNLEVAQNERWT